MAVDPSEPGGCPEPRTSAWARIAGGIGIATDPRKLILAVVGLAALWAGWAALGLVFRGAPGDWTPTRPVLLGEGRDAAPEAGRGRGFGDLPLDPTGRLSTGDMLDEVAGRVADPARTLMGPFSRIFATGNGAGLGAALHALLAALWAGVVWGIAGGAIARIAVVQAATGDRVGVAPALRFALHKAGTLVGTPLCPLIGVAFLAVPCAALGLLYWVPGPLGASIAGILAFLPLLIGLVMALILAGLAAGWPLMVATVAAEGEDGFDALSRSYAYVYQRPVRYASYVLAAWFFGVLGLAVIGAFAHAVVHLAEWGLALGGPDERLHRLFEGPRSPGDGIPAAIHATWVGVVALVASGWAYAYFWTAASLIYLLLRHDVDGTAWHEIYRPQHESDAFAPEFEPASPPGPVADGPGASPPEAGPAPIEPRADPVATRPEPPEEGPAPPGLTPPPPAGSSLPEGR